MNLNEDSVFESLMKVDDEVNINAILDDDCFEYIFRHLPLKERLIVEKVCVRWKKIGKWSNVRSFEICKKIFEEMEENKICLNEDEKINYIINILERCNSYLNYLSIDGNLELNYLVLTKILECKNIFNLTLSETSDSLFCDKNLGLLFKNNKKLSSISFESLCLQGDCFLNLNANFITKLELKYCTFESHDYLYNFFTMLKNIKIFIVCISGKIDFKNMIQSLNKSNCDGLEEFNLVILHCPLISDTECINDLSKLIFRQKSLLKFDTYTLEDNGCIMQSLPESLQELKIISKVLSSMHNFKNNLKVFSCVLHNKLTDNFIMNLVNCKALETVKLYVEDYSLTLKGETNFYKFRNLKVFELGFKGKNKISINNLLQNISHCKYLRYLRILSFYFTYASGLKSICKLSDLRELSISNYSFKTNQLINMVDKLKYLEKLTFKGSENLNYDVLKTLNQLKTNRQDNHSLYLHMLYYEFFNSINELKNFSLLKVEYNIFPAFLGSFSYLDSNDDDDNDEDDDDDDDDIDTGDKNTI